MSQASKSGLFEVWIGWLVEGDCVTPTRIHMFHEATFDTLEAVTAAVAQPRFDVQFCEVRPPAAWLKRQQKLSAIKQARRDAESTEVPF